MTPSEEIKNILMPILSSMRAHGSTEAEIIAYRNGFTTGAMWRQTHPHWISVEDDGNPIDTGWYIFTTGKIVDVGYYLGGNEWRDVHPTHWMPLPQAPTVAENATVKEKGGEHDTEE